MLKTKVTGTLSVFKVKIMKPVGTLVGSGQFRRSNRHRGAGASAGPGADVQVPGHKGRMGKGCLEWKLVADKGKVYLPI